MNFYYFSLKSNLGPPLIVYNISLENLEVSRVTTFKEASSWRDRFITIASELRRAIVPYSGRSHPLPLLTHLQLEQTLPLSLTLMAVTQLLMGLSSLSPTLVKMEYRNFPFHPVPPWLSNLKCVDQILVLRAWKRLLSLLLVSVSQSYCQARELQHDLQLASSPLFWAFTPPTLHLWISQHRLGLT